MDVPKYQRNAQAAYHCWEDDSQPCAHETLDTAGVRNPRIIPLLD